MGARGGGPGAGETDRLSDWRWEVWGRGEESRDRVDAKVRSEYAGTDGARTAGARDHCAANRRWNAAGWGRAGGVWVRELPDVLVRELSAVLNSERGLPGAVRVAGFGAASGTRPQVLPLILNFGELYAS